jgi:hypothetical protein
MEMAAAECEVAAAEVAAAAMEGEMSATAAEMTSEVPAAKMATTTMPAAARHGAGCERARREN